MCLVDEVAGESESDASNKKEIDVRCLSPIHFCKFRIHTPGYNYIAANNTCVFSMNSGCPKFVRYLYMERVGACNLIFKCYLL